MITQLTGAIFRAVILRLVAFPNPESVPTKILDVMTLFATM